MIIGTGIDVIEIHRIQAAVERWGEAFLNYVFTPAEIDHARKYKFPYPHYAGRFAAKEAIFKAIGIPKFTWHDISITNDPDGKPICVHRDPDFKLHILLSISHCRDYAVASAIITS